MEKKISPHFEDFYFESLISYFGILKERVKNNNNYSLESIEKVVQDTFLKYIDRTLTIELVENARETFLKNVENRNVQEKLKKNTILPIFQEQFNDLFVKNNIENNSKFAEKFINSGIDLFYECALVFSKGDIKNIINHIYE